MSTLVKVENNLLRNEKMAGISGWRNKEHTRSLVWPKVALSCVFILLIFQRHIQKQSFWHSEISSQSKLLSLSICRKYVSVYFKSFGCIGGTQKNRNYKLWCLFFFKVIFWWVKAHAKIQDRFPEIKTLQEVSSASLLFPTHHTHPPLPARPPTATFSHMLFQLPNCYMPWLIRMVANVRALTGSYVCVCECERERAG